MLSVAGVHFSYGRFRRRVVFAGLDWQVPSGRRTVLLGPNGAGKSTLLKLLGGLLSPDSGTISLDSSSNRHDVRSGVALMPQDVHAIRGMSVMDQVTYASWLSGQSLPEARSQAALAIDRARLSEQRHRPATKLSGGQLRRVGLAEVLASDARVLLLDEPTAGLDPAQRQNFRKLLQQQPVREGIVVSTHDVRDIDEDFDHLTVVADGRIRFDGTPHDFRQLAADRGLATDSIEDVFTHLVAGGLH